MIKTVKYILSVGCCLDLSSARFYFQIITKNSTIIVHRRMYYFFNIKNVISGRIIVYRLHGDAPTATDYSRILYMYLFIVHILIKKNNKKYNCRTVAATRSSSFVDVQPYTAFRARQERRRFELDTGARFVTQRYRVVLEELGQRQFHF